MINFRVSIAGIGNVGAHVIDNLSRNEKFIFEKSFIKFEIVGISAKNKNKKRRININKYKWYDNPLDLITDSNPNILVEFSVKLILFIIYEIPLNKRTLFFFIVMTYHIFF